MKSLFRAAKWFFVLVAVGSLLACVALAYQQSVGVVAVTVTATEEAVEPETGGLLSKLPLLGAKEKQPDYDLSLRLTSGRTVSLGTKQDQTAAQGLSWTLNDPVSVSEVASVRLRERGRYLSEPVVEVPLQPDGAAAKGYQFSFVLERSFAVGLHSFFGTPIGKAIAAAFFIAILALLLSFVRNVDLPAA